MTGIGDTEWYEEDAFCKKVKEVLENNEVKPKFDTFDLWEDEMNEDGNANP